MHSTGFSINYNLLFYFKSILIAELDALEADMGTESESSVPSYLQPDKEPDLDAELNLPAAPMGHVPGRQNVQVTNLIGRMPANANQVYLIA